MGTRGAFGVRVNGADKLMYNHFDSYPSCLGLKILSDVRNILSARGKAWLRSKAESLRQVNENDEPDESDQQLLEDYTDLKVGSQSKRDWYCLMRGLQSEIERILDIGIIIDNNAFMMSRSCQWGYVVNLDSDKLEVYCSSAENDSGRYNIPLVREFDLDDLPEDKIFLDILRNPC